MTVTPVPAAVADSMSATGKHVLPPYERLPEPALRFDPVDTGQHALNPLAGLVRFGPYSARAWARAGGGVRVALLGPEDSLRGVRDLLNALWEQHAPNERRGYLPVFPGFRRVFGTTLIPAADAAQIPLNPTLDDQLIRAKDPHLVLADALLNGLRSLAAVRGLFDVVVFYLPHRWAPLFTVGEFDLHDHVKAFAAQAGLPTQIITDDALTYHCRASVAWRLSIALYAKAGGTPYKLVTGEGALDRRTAYVGLAYGVRQHSDGSTGFVVCCSQMFDGAGGGLEFVAYDVTDGVDPRNPLLSREQMRVVLSRSLSVYADRHAGRTPAELVVHKQIPFTDDEIAGCVDAWGRVDNLECLSLTRPAWRGVLVNGRAPDGSPEYGYAVPRGTLQQLDGHTALLWVAGDAPDATLNGRSYLQGGKGTPRPLMLTRHTGAGPLSQPAQRLLALSKMDWNNDALYGALPATVSYAKLLAKVVKHADIPDLPFDYRLFM